MNTLTITPVGRTLRGALTTDHGMYMVEVYHFDHITGTSVDVRQMFGDERMFAFAGEDFQQVIGVLLTLRKNDGRLIDTTAALEA